MSFDETQIKELKSLCPSLMGVEDGGTAYISIPKLKLPNECAPEVVDALLCPSTRDGYNSRLFLSEKVNHKGPGQNWNPNDGVIIANRRWWAVSWNTNAEKLRLLQMVLNHLDAFTCKQS